MSEILDFVLNNFEILRSGDYLILATFVALVGAAVIFGFRAIYAARYQAQSDLLQLKDQTVGALTTHLEITTRERDDLREKMAQLGRLEESGTATEAELDYMHAEVLKLIAAYLIALLDRVAINYRVLFIYQTIYGEITPQD